MNNPYGIEALWSQGDMVIKSVAVMLLLMSIASWYVIAVRSWGLFRLRKPSRALGDFWHAQSFAEGLHILGDNRDDNPFRRLAEEGQAALDHHTNHKTDLHGHLPLAEWLTACLRGSIVKVQSVCNAVWRSSLLLVQRRPLLVCSVPCGVFTTHW